MEKVIAKVIDELKAKRNLKVPEVAEILSVSRGMVYRLMTEGKLSSVHIGSARRVPLDALESYLAEIRGE